MYKKFNSAMAVMAFSLLLFVPAQGADKIEIGTPYNLNESMSSTDAPALSGLEPGSDLWVQNMEKIEEDYQKELQRIDESETRQTILREDERLRQEEAARFRNKPAGDSAAAVPGSYDAANALFEQVGASGESRGFEKVSGLVPGANISGSTQQAADRGEAQAIKRLERAAKQSGRGFYFLGGSKINVIEPGGYR